MQILRTLHSKEQNQHSIHKTPKKRTRKWYQEVKTWGVNNAKWKSAKDWCANRGMEFKILTEKHLNPQYK